MISIQVYKVVYSRCVHVVETAGVAEVYIC